MKYTTDDREDISQIQHLSCVHLAKTLLGKILCRKISGRVLKGTIVETEAYLGSEDRASHSFRGRRTSRNEAMYMKTGTCYVYIIYGIHHCFNISSREEGAAVLIRALQPLDGIDLMYKHREIVKMKRDKRERSIEDIANGPSKLCVAMGISKAEINKEDLMASNKIWLEEGREIGESEIATTKRIGIKNAGEWGEKHLRFYIKNNSFVSCRKKRDSK